MELTNMESIQNVGRTESGTGPDRVWGRIIRSGLHEETADHQSGFRADTMWTRLIEATYECGGHWEEYTDKIILDEYTPKRTREEDTGRV